MSHIQQARQQIKQQADLGQYTHENNLDETAWWLLGTSGCHLCEQAEHTLRLFSSVNPVTIQKVDIADFDEQLMDQFATLIPVILTPTTQINYPFSVMDLTAHLS